MIPPLFAWLSTLFLAASLFYAPLAYGCTRLETLPPLFTLLAASMVMGAISLALNRRWPAIPGWAIVCVVALLIQGWWMAWDPMLHPEDFVGESLADTSMENIQHLSSESMLATSFLLGIFILLCELLGDARLRRFLLLATAISGVLISVIGIVLKLCGKPLMRYVWAPPDIDWNDFAFYRYHGNAGAFLNLTWPLILVFVRRAYSPTIGYTKKIIWTFAALACGLALCLNASKASLVIGLLILPWPFSTWLKNLPRKTLVGFIAGTLLIVTAGIIVSSKFGYEAAFERITEKSEVTASFEGRLNAYQQYVDAVPNAGFFGVGPGLFQIAFPYQNSPLGNISVGLREYAHEDYLQTIIEWGWLGSLWWFILVAGGLFLAFRSYSYRELFTSRTDRHLVLAAILGVCGTLAQALIDFPLQVASLRLFFVVMLALCWASPKLLATPETTAPNQRRSRSTPKLKTEPVKTSSHSP
jgi:hypothetical protein